MLEKVTQDRLDKLYKLLEWALFLGLCITAIVFTKEVWKEYESFDSNYKKSEEKISKAPTICEFLIIIAYELYL